MAEYKKFLVWSATGEDQSGAKVVNALSVTDAAEQWAETEWTPDDGDEIALKVRGPDDALSDVTLYANHQPSFLGVVRS